MTERLASIWDSELELGFVGISPFSPLHLITQSDSDRMVSVGFHFRNNWEKVIHGSAYDPTKIEDISK